MPNRRNAVYLLLIFCLLTGVFTGRAFFFNLAYLFAGLLLISFLWAWVSVRWISISRRTRTRRAQVGRSMEESFAVHNTSLLPKLWLEVRDHSDLPGHRASQVVPTVMGRKKYRWDVSTPCLTRGEFRLGPITLLSGDPFGLFISPRRLGATSRIVVYPATVPVTHFEMPMGVLSGGEAQRKRANYITTNAAGVREYVPGDNFNRIHWRSSARRDELMVKEFEIDPLVDVWLLVDFSAAALVEDPSVQRIGRTGPVIPMGVEIPPSTEEYNVVIAASLAQYFIEDERSVGFAAYTPHREIYDAERGPQQLSRILQTLAVARSFSPYTLAQTLSLETHFLTRGTTLVIITASLDSAWVAQAQVLGRKGIRPMCVLVDPASFGGQFSSEPLRAMLRSARIPSVLIQRGDDLTSALAQRPL
ncbi:MAG: DUF58 domain-containing protein [Chloroflexi bacterium]|nr:DUF58 domain-containing protein [Chloroflexota bacterium]